MPHRTVTIRDARKRTFIWNSVLYNLWGIQCLRMQLEKCAFKRICEEEEVVVMDKRTGERAWKDLWKTDKEYYRSFLSVSCR